MTIILVFLLLQLAPAFAASDETESRDVILRILPESGGDFISLSILPAGEEITCPICSVEITQQREVAKKFFECEHEGEFHRECIEKWLKTSWESGAHFVCPICRAKPLPFKNGYMKQYGLAPRRPREDRAAAIRERRTSNGAYVDRRSLSKKIIHSILLGLELIVMAVVFILFSPLILIAVIHDVIYISSLSRL
jgi:hypothetical protein